jgi:hypothetical protein
MRLKDFWTLASEIMEEPMAFSEAIKHDGWKEAIRNEVDSILRNKMWDILERPQGQTPITAKWIYRIKRGSSS